MSFSSRVFSSTRCGSFFSIFLLASALILAGTGCDSGGGGNNDGGDGGSGGPTLADRISEQDELSTFASALETADQSNVLSNRTLTFTVFAPSNSAFSTYDFLLNDPEAVSTLMRNHRVLGSAVPSDSLENGDTFETVGGDEIVVRVDGDGNVSVDGAPVTTTDIEGANGILHIVGEVMLPTSERLRRTPEAESFFAALESAGLVSAFNNVDNDWTTFVPSNEAFSTVANGSFTGGQLQEILQYHVLEDRIDSESLNQMLDDNSDEVTVQTLQGENMTITRQNDGTIVFNDGAATLNADLLDQRTSTGLFHLIDGVLLPPSFTRSVRYELSANDNSGAFPSGVSGQVTFWEISENQSAVTLELEGGITDTTLAHPAHIHNNSADEGGGIAIHLTPIDGTGGGGTSARLVNRSIDELVSFDGYVNIHESVGNLGDVVSQGNIGANAEGTLAAGLDLVDGPRSVEYNLSANPNTGEYPTGFSGTATFRELTGSLTYVQVALDDGPTGADFSHPAHIHNNSASEGGEIEYYLSPVDGSDAEARSGKIIAVPYDDLTTFDGYINVHESLKALDQVISQGDIGANN